MLKACPFFKITSLFFQQNSTRVSHNWILIRLDFPLKQTFHKHHAITKARVLESYDTRFPQSVPSLLINSLIGPNLLKSGYNTNYIRRFSMIILVCPYWFIIRYIYTYTLIKYYYNFPFLWIIIIISLLFSNLLLLLLVNEWHA